jgi:hypothetical protein
MRSPSLPFAASVLAVATLLAACGTDAMATDACRKIEQARCRKAPSCPALGISPGTGVEECVQFARDRCLHGLAVADPGAAVVDQCVAAIDTATSCDVIASPSSAPACAFLEPTPPVDAGSDTPDAAADASTEPDAAPDEGG